MKILLLFTVVLLPLILSNNAYAQEPMVMEQVTPTGKIKVQLTWPEVLPDQLYNIGIKFLDAKTDQLMCFSFPIFFFSFSSILTVMIAMIFVIRLGIQKDYTAMTAGQSFLVSVGRLIPTLYPKGV